MVSLQALPLSHPLGRLTWSTPQPGPALSYCSGKAQGQLERDVAHSFALIIPAPTLLPDIDVKEQGRGRRTSLPCLHLHPVDKREGWLSSAQFVCCNGEGKREGRGRDLFLHDLTAQQVRGTAGSPTLTLRGSSPEISTSKPSLLCCQVRRCRPCSPECCR